MQLCDSDIAPAFVWLESGNGLRRFATILGGRAGKLARVACLVAAI